MPQQSTFFFAPLPPAIEDVRRAQRALDEQGARSLGLYMAGRRTLDEHESLLQFLARMWTRLAGILSDMQGEA